MQKPTDWLWLGIAILAADLIVRHMLGGPGFVHIGAFAVGGGTIMWGIAKMIQERY